MDGIYPKSACYKLPGCCGPNGPMTGIGGAWVSNNFIRNRGQTSFVTMDWDVGWPDYLVNNPPPTTVYVRVAPSQYDGSKNVFWINGWERPRLVLKRGHKYQFNVNASGHPFYFSLDSLGGAGNKNPVTAVPPSDYYVYTYVFNDTLPDTLTYACSLHEGMGGAVKLTR